MNLKLEAYQQMHERKTRKGINQFARVWVSTLKQDASNCDDYG
jgi:hypothetical protein